MSEIRKIEGGKLIGIKTSIFTIFNQEKHDPKSIQQTWSTFFEKYRQSELPAETVFYGAAIPSLSADVPMEFYVGAIFPESAEVPSGFDSIKIRWLRIILWIWLFRFNKLARL